MTPPVRHICRMQTEDTTGSRRRPIVQASLTTTGIPKADADKQTQYYAHVQNELTYQSAAPVTLSYQVNDIKQNYDGKGAVLTVSDLYNETGHHCDTYTIDVSFLEKRSKGQRRCVLPRL